MATIALGGETCFERFNKWFTGPLYVLMSQVTWSDNIGFGSEKAPTGSHPFLTPTMVNREKLLTFKGVMIMSMLSDESIFNDLM